MINDPVIVGMGIFCLATYVAAVTGWVRAMAITDET